MGDLIIIGAWVRLEDKLMYEQLIRVSLNAYFCAFIFIFLTILIMTLGFIKKIEKIEKKKSELLLVLP